MSQQAVTHTVKSVRKHHIDIKLPPPPKDDQESFVLHFPGTNGMYPVEMHPQDFQQFVAVVRQVRQQVMGGDL